MDVGSGKLSCPLKNDSKEADRHIALILSSPPRNLARADGSAPIFCVCDIVNCPNHIVGCGRKRQFSELVDVGFRSVCISNKKFGAVGRYCCVGHASQSCLVRLLIAMHFKRHFRRCWCCPPAVATYLRTVAAGTTCAWGGVSEVLMLYCFHPASQSHCFSCSSNAFGRHFGAVDASATAMHFVGAFRNCWCFCFRHAIQQQL